MSTTPQQEPTAVEGKTPYNEMLDALEIELAWYVTTQQAQHEGDKPSYTDLTTYAIHRHREGPYANIHIDAATMARVVQNAINTPSRIVYPNKWGISFQNSDIAPDNYHVKYGNEHLSWRNDRLGFITRWLDRTWRATTHPAVKDNALSGEENPAFLADIIGGMHHPTFYDALSWLIRQYPNIDREPPDYSEWEQYINMSGVPHVPQSDDVEFPTYYDAQGREHGEY